MGSEVGSADENEKGIVMDYVVGWGTLALINAAMANIDRRSPLIYFIGSLFFGPIVTLILAATRETAESKLHQVDLIKGRRRLDPTAAE